VFQYGRYKPRNYSFVSSLHMCRLSAQCNRIALRKYAVAGLGVPPASDHFPRFVLLLAFLDILLEKPRTLGKRLAVKICFRTMRSRCVAMAVVKVILACYSLG
jgi:hypothetical protein